MAGASASARHRRTRRDARSGQDRYRGRAVGQRQSPWLPQGYRDRQRRCRPVRRRRHALCWVHTERLVHKLDTFTDLHYTAQQRSRCLIWWFYRDLKAYRCDPTSRHKAALRARFDWIFRRRTGFDILDRLLARLHANKPELLMVLERPEIPLHTNGSENDIRCHVTRRSTPPATTAIFS